nr:TonB-dependent receptor [Prolixibacteraceae bacterium]
TYSNFKALNHKANRTFKDQPLKAVLETLLQNTNLSFKVIAGKVALFEKENKKHGNKRATIHGYISDAESGERLINANIYNPDNYVGTISNNFGFYSYSTLSGKLKLAVTYMGYKSQTFYIDLKSDTTINIALQPKSDELAEITVMGTQTNQVENTQMSMNNISIQKLKKVPVILGEADVLKVIQLLPGVQAGVEGTSGIYVRGGGLDQNLFLLDGVPIYNPTHLLGFISVFNPDAIKSVKLYKGGFPARFGGRLSSVVDISMKDGNMKEFKGNFSIGLLSSKLQLEGPIVKDKTSFMFSARRSYLDILAQPVIWFSQNDDIMNMKATANLQDMNLKINHIFNEKSRLYLSGYHGKDKVKIADSYHYNDEVSGIWDYNLNWGNSTAVVRWNYLLNKRLFSNTTLTYNNYNFLQESNTVTENRSEKQQIVDYYRYSSGIKDLSAKIDFDYFLSPKHNIKFGTAYTHHTFSPGISRLKFETEFKDYQQTEINTLLGGSKKYVNDLSSYMEDNIHINDHLKINAGVHFSMFVVDQENFINFQPRVSVLFKANSKLSLKASYARMAQYIHLLATSGINMPSDLWVPITKEFKPPISDQIAIGTAIHLPNNFMLTVEGYYKSIKNLIEYKEGASYLDQISSWENKVEKGIGWSYGGEIMLEKTLGNTTGWLGYTLSKSERQFENLNFGQPFPAKYDRRHDISLVITHIFSEKFDIGGTWVYGTGSSYTLSTMNYPLLAVPGRPSSNQYLEANISRNNFRMPAYHRMDVGMNFHKEKKNGIRTWNVSIYNCYNHQNPFMLNWIEKKVTMNIDGEEKQVNQKVLQQLSLLPIIPSVSYSFTF